VRAHAHTRTHTPAYLFYLLSTNNKQGVFLIKNHAAFEAQSSLNGRILAQTAATLIKTTVIEPAAPSGA